MKIARLLVCLAAGAALCGCSSSAEFEKVKADAEEGRRSAEAIQEARKDAEKAKQDAEMARVESAAAKADIQAMRAELDRMRAERAQLPRWAKFEGGVLELTGTVDTGTVEIGDERRVNFPLPYASPPDVVFGTAGTTDQRGIDLVRSTASVKVEANGFACKRQMNPVAKSETYAGTLKWTARGIPDPK